jgi:hypothetical protein
MTSMVSSGVHCPKAKEGCDRDMPEDEREKRQNNELRMSLEARDAQRMYVSEWVVGMDR